MTVIIFSLLIFLTSSYGDSINKKSAKLDSIQYSLESTSLNYEFDNNLDSKILELSPIKNMQAGLSVTKGNYSLGFGFEDPAQNEDMEELGRSKSFDAQFSSTYKKYYIELFYQKYQGLSAKYDGISTPIDYNYESLNYGLYTAKFLNKEYDPHYSLYHFSFERVEKSSMVLALTANKNIFKNKKGILPSKFSSEYSEYIGVKELSQTVIGGSFGYTQMKSYENKFYVQYLLALGPNLIMADYKGGNIEDTTKTGLGAYFNFDFGYQFNKSLLGISATSSRSSLEASEDTDLSYSRMRTQFYYHYFF